MEARDKVGGRLVLDYLIREGDQLPKKGKKSFAKLGGLAMVTAQVGTKLAGETSTKETDLLLG